ncbi:hypothetical protein [Streptomyces sp. NPDC049555]|uniref:hypothetical protein n=1 Tax=Streptomyces sp. NPDC049555 TaxID=3154930 RepID=UPI00341D717D
MMKKKPLLVGRKEFTDLYDVHENAVSARWVPAGIVSYGDAVIVSGKYVWPGGVAVRFALPEGSVGRQLNPRKLAALKEEQGATWVPESKDDLPALMGTHEYAELYGVAHAVVSNYVRRGSALVAAPDYYVSGSPVWLVETVRKYAPTAEKASRTGAWVLHEDVAKALEAKKYKGPGSTVATRGRNAAKPAK